MTFELGQSIEILERTPGVLRAWLGRLSDGWVLSNYGPETFSPFDVVGHLIHAEQTNWMTRARVILEHGEATAFPPFDRHAMREISKGKSMLDLLQDFELERSRNLDDLRALKLTPQKLALRGTHPQFGPVTLKQLLASWAVHDLGHLHQIAKAMAFQYREEVGPWREYLTILPKG